MKTIHMYVYLVYSTYDYNGKNMFWNNIVSTHGQKINLQIYIINTIILHKKKKAFKQLWISSNLDSS